MSLVFSIPQLDTDHDGTSNAFHVLACLGYALDADRSRPSLTGWIQINYETFMQVSNASIKSIFVILPQANPRGLGRFTDRPESSLIALCCLLVCHLQHNHYRPKPYLSPLRSSPLA